ncbi:hypothetical protein [Streptomyces sp. NPDC057877]|uniref:hypothetical protein n=1 Tax=Streptomyces sp. NPDC057877 TaxID=3346269 RepID=UPI00369F11B3
MSAFRALDRRRPAQRPRAKGAVGRAIVLALAGTALAAGLRHATTDSAVSWPALLVAAAVLAVCAYPAMRSEAPRVGVLVVTAVQALLPGWLELTSTGIPAARLDDHPRLPAAWHHNPLAMAALHFLAGLALVLLLRGTANVPAGLAHSAASTARRWWTRLLYAIGLVLRHTNEPLPRPGPAPRSAVTLPRPRSLAALLHRVQPCAP